MGKKSKEPNQETSDAIKSLFSDNNPFRRKPESESHPPPTQSAAAAAAAAAELGSGLPNDAEADAKKRKRDKKLENPITTESIPNKRKKAESDKDIGEVLKTKKKRKIDELEAEHAKRNYGEIVEKDEVFVKVGEKRKVKEDAVVVSKERAEIDEVLVKVGEKRKVKEDAVIVSNEEEEGFDDESKLLRTIFVGNLPVKIKKKVLMKEFERFGEIESARIRSVPLVDSKAPRKGAIIKGKVNEAVGRVNAYIVFNNEQSAKAALSHNMSMLGENHIRVDIACPPRKKLKGETQRYERKKTVFVGNLPFDVKDEELYQLFCGSNQMESSVEAIRVVRDPQTSIGKGIAYVLFKTRDAANKIVRRGGLKIRDRDLRVCHAKLDTAPSNKKAESKRDIRRRKFEAISDEQSSWKDGKKPKASAASLSYQGLRSSKSGVVKKSGLSSRPVGGHVNHGTKRTGGGFDSKDQKAKRPAVAARKAKQLAKKRKMENGTPENTHRNKKVRRH